jgi:YD repeat-containing protein
MEMAKKELKWLFGCTNNIVLFSLTLKIDASNVTTTYIYDALNRLITIQFPDTTQNINYYYDDIQFQNSKGRLTSMTDLPTGQAGPSGTTSGKNSGKNRGR